jgi:hypothetical protein
MDTLTEMIRQAEAEVQEREGRTVAADSRAAAAQADAAAEHEGLKEARIVLEWLRRRGQSQPVAAVAGMQSDRPQPQPATRFGRPVPEISQADLCLQALEALGGTATNKQIRDRLLRDGHDVDLDKVRNSLKYMSRKTPPPVETDHGSGLWRLLRIPGTPAPFVPAGTLPMNGVSGGES